MSSEKWYKCSNRIAVWKSKILKDISKELLIWKYSSNLQLLNLLLYLNYILSGNEVTVR